MELLTSRMRFLRLEVEQRAVLVALSRGRRGGREGSGGGASSSLSQLRHLKAPFLVALSLLQLFSSASTIITSLIFSSRKVNPRFTSALSAFSPTASANACTRSSTVFLSRSTVSRLALPSRPSSTSLQSFLRVVLSCSMARSSALRSSSRLNPATTSATFARSFSNLRATMPTCSSVISLRLASRPRARSHSANRPTIASSSLPRQPVTCAARSLAGGGRSSAGRRATEVRFSLILTMRLLETSRVWSRYCWMRFSSWEILLTIWSMSSWFSQRVALRWDFIRFLDRDSPATRVAILLWLWARRISLISSSPLALASSNACTRPSSRPSAASTASRRPATSTLSSSSASVGGGLLSFFSRKERRRARSSWRASRVAVMRLLSMTSEFSNSAIFSKAFLSASLRKSRRQLLSYWLARRIRSSCSSTASSLRFMRAPSDPASPPTVFPSSSVRSACTRTCRCMSSSQADSLCASTVTSKKFPSGSSIQNIEKLSQPHHGWAGGGHSATREVGWYATRSLPYSLGHSLDDAEFLAEGAPFALGEVIGVFEVVDDGEEGLVGELVGVHILELVEVAFLHVVVETVQRLVVLPAAPELAQTQPVAVLPLPAVPALDESLYQQRRLLLHAPRVPRSLLLALVEKQQLEAVVAGQGGSLAFGAQVCVVEVAQGSKGGFAALPSVLPPFLLQLSRPQGVFQLGTLHEVPSQAHLGLPLADHRPVFGQFLLGLAVGGRGRWGRGGDGEGVGGVVGCLQGRQNAMAVLAGLVEVLADVAELLQFPAQLPAGPMRWAGRGEVRAKLATRGGGGSGGEGGGELASRVAEVAVEGFFKQVFGVLHLVDDGLAVVAKLLPDGAVVDLHRHELLRLLHHATLPHDQLRIHRRIGRMTIDYKPLCQTPKYPRKQQWHGKQCNFCEQSKHTQGLVRNCYFKVKETFTKRYENSLIIAFSPCPV